MTKGLQLSQLLWHTTYVTLQRINIDIPRVLFELLVTSSMRGCLAISNQSTEWQRKIYPLPPSPVSFVNLSPPLSVLAHILCVSWSRPGPDRSTQSVVPKPSHSLCKRTQDNRKLILRLIYFVSKFTILLNSDVYKNFWKNDKEVKIHIVIFNIFLKSQIHFNATTLSSPKLFFYLTTLINYISDL